MILQVKENNDLRLDQYLTENTDYSRSKIQQMIKEDNILVNGNSTKSSYVLKSGDEISIEEIHTVEMSAEPEKMDLDIVYEDEDIIVVNKANGVVVHPAVGNNHGTLVNGLLYHSKQLSDKNGEFRPGIVHRIDAFTTGLLVVAKINKAHEFLAEQFENKTNHRKYLAMVWGVIPNDTGTIDAPIGRDDSDRKKMAVTAKNSKSAITHFRVLERLKDATMIELILETGRTHQIRVHMDYIGYPVVNDPVYGRRKKIDESGQCLHAKELGFIHPTTKEYVEFSCEVPECFKEIYNILKER